MRAVHPTPLHSTPLTPPRPSSVVLRMRNALRGACTWTLFTHSFSVFSKQGLMCSEEELPESFTTGECVSAFVDTYLHMMVDLQRVNTQSKYCYCHVSCFFVMRTAERNIYFIIWEYIFYIKVQRVSNQHDLFELQKCHHH